MNFQHQQSYLGQPSYFKAGSTVDPRTLQGALPVQPAPSPATQQPQSMLLSFSQSATLTKPVSVVIPKPEKAPQSKPSKDSIAPKKTKKKGTNDPASDSEDELSIQAEEPPEPTPAILSIDLPTEEGQKAQYLAVHAVFSPRNKPATPEKVRGGIASFGDSVRALRDSWKVKNENLRKAELPDSPTAKDADALKKEVARYRSLIQEVMTRSLNFGHPSIVKRYVILATPLDISVQPPTLVHCDIASLHSRRAVRNCPNDDLVVRDMALPGSQCALGLYNSTASGQTGFVNSSTCINSPQIGFSVLIDATHSDRTIFPLSLITMRNFY